MSLFSCERLAYNYLETVMNWRMSPSVTKFMNTDVSITIEDQIKWFENNSKDPDFFFWIITVDGNACGIANIYDVDHTNKRCEWGYYVAEKKYRSMLLAVSIEASLYDFAFDKLRLNKIQAKTFCNNASVIKLHELCGCEYEGTLKEHVFKNNVFYDICVQSMRKSIWKDIKNTFNYTFIDFK